MPTIHLPAGGGGGGGGPATQVIASFVAGEALAAGKCVSVFWDAASSSTRVRAVRAALDDHIVGISTSTASAGANVSVGLVGSFAVAFSAAPAAASNGQWVFADPNSNGGAVVSRPTSGVNLMRVGFLAGADGVTVTPTVIFSWAFIAALP